MIVLENWILNWHSRTNRCCITRENLLSGAIIRHPKCSRCPPVYDMELGYIQAKDYDYG